MTQQFSLFDYGVLDAQVAVRVRAAAERIRIRLKRSAEDIVAVGLDLIAVKADLKHGEFGAWLGREFEMDDNTANRFMQVGKTFGEKSQFGIFKPSVLYALAAPSTPPEVRDTALAAAESGEKVTIKQVEAWKAQIAEAKEETRQVREQMDHEREQAFEQIRQLRSDLESTENERTSLEAEIKKAKENPPKDEKAQKALEKLQADLVKANEEAEKKERLLKHAEDEANRHAKDANELQEELEEARQQLQAIAGADPAKGAPKYSPEEIAAFERVYFEKGILNNVETKAALAVAVLKGVLEEAEKASGELSPDRWEAATRAITPVLNAAEQIRSAISGAQSPKIVSIARASQA